MTSKCRVISSTWYHSNAESSRFYLLSFNTFETPFLLPEKSPIWKSYAASSKSLTPRFCSPFSSQFKLPQVYREGWTHLSSPCRYTLYRCACQWSIHRPQIASIKVFEALWCNTRASFLRIYSESVPREFSNFRLASVRPKVWFWGLANFLELFASSS